MKKMEFKKQLSGLSKAELSERAKIVYSQIVQNRLELAAGKAQNKRTVFNLRKQLAIIKSKIYESLHR
jgi:ribosomal protein L29